MPLTFQEISDKLKQCDEITLLEILEINSEEIVERFGDKIEENIEKFEEDFDDEDNNNME